MNYKYSKVYQDAEPGDELVLRDGNVERLDLNKGTRQGVFFYPHGSFIGFLIIRREETPKEKYELSRLQHSIPLVTGRAELDTSDWK